jgi:hypothetical protein
MHSSFTPLFAAAFAPVRYVKSSGESPPRSFASRIAGRQAIAPVLYKAICHFPQIFLWLDARVMKMMQDRMIQALGRIEIALGKLETKGVSGQSSGADAALRQQHEQLKSEARTAIAQIDTIIAKLET